MIRDAGAPNMKRPDAKACANLEAWLKVADGRYVEIHYATDCGYAVTLFDDDESIGTGGSVEEAFRSALAFKDWTQNNETP